MIRIVLKWQYKTVPIEIEISGETTATFSTEGLDKILDKATSFIDKVWESRETRQPQS